MTTMFTDWFGVPHQPFRSGLWARLKPSQQSLYVGLLYESERCSTRALARSDKQMRKVTGVSPRAQRDARIKLQEFGLIRFDLQHGGICNYVLCDPVTGEPYAGDPYTPVRYAKKPVSAGSPTAPSAARQPVSTEARSGSDQSPRRPEPKVSGLPMKF